MKILLINSPKSDSGATRLDAKVERTQAIVSQVWQQVKGFNFERLIVLQQTVTALKSGTLSETLYNEALQALLNKGMN